HDLEWLQAPWDPTPASSSQLQPAVSLPATARWKVQKGKSADWRRPAEHGGKEQSAGPSRVLLRHGYNANRALRSCWNGRAAKWEQPISHQYAHRKRHVPQQVFPVRQQSARSTEG